MIAGIYLIASFLAGLTAVQAVFPRLPAVVRLAGGFTGGLIVTAWVTFLVAWALAGMSNDSLLIGVFFATGVNAMVVAAWGRGLRFHQFRLSNLEAALFVASLVFSFWLMDARLSGSPPTVSANTWGDTALHVSLARSFSEGHNYPPEYPFFGGETIRYHFGYDFFAGALEKGGLPIVWAFNLPGALGFTAMMMLVFELGRLLFRRVAVGVMAVVLLITNSSLSFLRYFELYGNDIPMALRHLWDKQPPPFNDRYLAVGPYLVEGKIDQISIFWTLNVFLTQTHLIIAMAFVLFVAYGLARPLLRGEPLKAGPAAALGVLMGMSFWLNGVLYVAAMVFFVALIAVFALSASVSRPSGGTPAGGWHALVQRLREAAPFLAPAVLLALPQAVWLNGGLHNGGSVRWHVGYLVCSSPDASCNATGFKFDHLSHYWDFIEWWWLNLGFALPLMVFGAVWATPRERKVLLGIMAIFIFGNFVQLSRDLGGHNHKIFNLWEILMNIFAAYAFVRLWDGVRCDVRIGGLRVRAEDIRLLARTATPVVFVFLALSGIIDFMVIKNDAKFPVFGDKAQTIQWVERYTPGDSMFLTAYGELYTAPALAGRRLFLGYEPWAGSAGYEVEPRRAAVAAIYGAGSKGEACRLLMENRIDYVQIGPSERSGGRFTLNEGLFTSQFVRAEPQDGQGDGVAIYDVARSCRGAPAAFAP